MKKIGIFCFFVIMLVLTSSLTTAINLNKNLEDKKFSSCNEWDYEENFDSSSDKWKPDPNQASNPYHNLELRNGWIRTTCHETNKGFIGVAIMRDEYEHRYYLTDACKKFDYFNGDAGDKLIQVKAEMTIRTSSDCTTQNVHLDLYTDTNKNCGRIIDEKIQPGKTDTFSGTLNVPSYHQSYNKYYFKIELTAGNEEGAWMEITQLNAAFTIDFADFPRIKKAELFNHQWEYPKNYYDVRVIACDPEGDFVYIGVESTDGKMYPNNRWDEGNGYENDKEVVIKRVEYQGRGKIITVHVKDSRGNKNFAYLETKEYKPENNPQIKNMNLFKFLNEFLKFFLYKFSID